MRSYPLWFLVSHLGRMTDNWSLSKLRQPPTPIGTDGRTVRSYGRTRLVWAGRHGRTPHTHGRTRSEMPMMLYGQGAPGYEAVENGLNLQWTPKMRPQPVFSI